MESPLVDIRRITQRHDVVGALCEQHEIRQSLHDTLLREVSDVGQQARRLSDGKATLEDVFKLYRMVEILPEITELFESLRDQENWQSFSNLFHVSRI